MYFQKIPKKMAVEAVKRIGPFSGEVRATSTRTSAMKSFNTLVSCLNSVSEICSGESRRHAGRQRAGVGK